MLHVSGFATQRQAYTFTPDESERMMARFEAEVDPAAFPRMIEHVAYHDAVEAGEVSPPDAFTFVLDLILDGLDAR